MNAPDLKTAQYHNSPSIADWPVTSSIVDISWSNGRIHVVHTKTGQWAPVPFETTVQEATLWLGLYYNGTWHFAGAERLRPGQTEKDLGSPFDVTGGWLYDPNRWGDMANRMLVPGDTIAFLVTSGDMRSQMAPGPRERSNVVTYRVTAAGFAPTILPGETVTTAPPVTTTPPASGGGTVALESALVVELSKITARLDVIEDYLRRVEYRGEGSLGPLRGVAVLKPTLPDAKKAA